MFDRDDGSGAQFCILWGTTIDGRRLGTNGENRKSKEKTLPPESGRHFYPSEPIRFVVAETMGHVL